MRATRFVKVDVNLYFGQKGEGDASNPSNEALYLRAKWTGQTQCEYARRSVRKKSGVIGAN